MTANTYALAQGAYLSDLLEQPEALRRTIAEKLPARLAGIATQFCGSNPPFVVLTGMGSSFHALNPLAIRLAEAGIRAIMVETSELIYYWTHLFGSGTLIVAVSQSGRSAEILRMLNLNAGRSTLLAVTNDEDSPLSRAADCVVPLSAGVEATVSCKTYLCTLFALARIGEALCTGDLDFVPPGSGALAADVDEYLSHLQQHVEEAQDCLLPARHIILAGRGHSLASAGTGGLIIKEAARFPAEGMSAAAFRHGPLEMVSSALALFVFQGDRRSEDLSTRLVGDVAALGATAHLIGKDAVPRFLRPPATTDLLRPIMEILPVQIVTLALAAREGREAGAFSHASKITSIE
jgi:glucosamine--fructose-6-phosphate aminotransferase (isomerizing)